MGKFNLTTRKAYDYTIVETDAQTRVAGVEGITLSPTILIGSGDGGVLLPYTSLSMVGENITEEEILTALGLSQEELSTFSDFDFLASNDAAFSAKSELIALQIYNITNALKQMVRDDEISLFDKFEVGFQAISQTIATHDDPQPINLSQKATLREILDHYLNGLGLEEADLSINKAAAIESIAFVNQSLTEMDLLIVDGLQSALAISNELIAQIEANALSLGSFSYDISAQVTAPDGLIIVTVTFSEQINFDPNTQMLSSHGSFSDWSVSDNGLQFTGNLLLEETQLDGTLTISIEETVVDEFGRIPVDGYIALNLQIDTIAPTAKLEISDATHNQIRNYH